MKVVNKYQGSHIKVGTTVDLINHFESSHDDDDYYEKNHHLLLSEKDENLIVCQKRKKKISLKHMPYVVFVVLMIK